MSKATNHTLPGRLVLGALIALFVSAFAISSARAATPVGWQINSFSDSTASATGSAELSTTTQGSASPATDEVQRLDVDAAGGHYRLGFESQSTADIPYKASPAEVQSALEALPAIGAGNVAVSGSAGFFGNSTDEFGLSHYKIAFGGALGAQDVAQIEAEAAAAPLAGRLQYWIEVFNRTEDFTDSTPLTVTVTLPPGITAVSFEERNFSAFQCGDVAGLSVISCETSAGSAIDKKGSKRFLLTTAVDPSTAPGVRVATAAASGRGLAADDTVDPVRITAAEPAFGIDVFDAQVLEGSGETASRASGHPATFVNAVDFNTHTDTSPTPGMKTQIIGPNEPLEPVKDVVVELPPGFLGNPSGVEECTSGQLANTEGVRPRTLCPPESQVGSAEFILNGLLLGDTFGPYPVFKMVAPPGVPARLGINAFGVLVSLDASVRSDSDYGITVSSRNTSAGLPLGGAHVELWGVPADPAHERERACPGEYGPGESGPSCASEAEPQAFFRNPTSCSGGALTFSAHASSWFDPSDFVSAAAQNHEAPGYPYPAGPATFPAGYSGPESWGAPVGIEECGQVPFEPSFAASPTTQSADSPTGLSLDIGLPTECWDEKASAGAVEAAICQSDLKQARVSLPEGLSINPSAASGRAACSAGQIGLTTAVGASPVHFDKSAASCPEASKLGTVEIATPLLDQPLRGAIYLAQQSQNPFGSLLATYLVVEGSGVVVKQAGEIELSPSGRLTTAFSEVPQLPFANVHVELFGGPRAALRTPSACGTYTTNASLTPWSGNGAVERQSSFQITQGCGGGFDPQLAAGTQNPLGGSYSPFHLRLTRADGTQELAGLSATLAAGLIGKPAGIPYCPDSVLASYPAATVLGTGAGEIAAPRCPAASQVGTVTVGAGAGPTPFYTASGRAYLAGPYKGAPLSLAVIAPAVAGPFDLGSVLVRNALRIDPVSAQVSAVSDPLPRVLHGIPLDLRDVRVDLNRPEFTLNPTSCEPKSISATLTSAQGQSAERSVHFQAAACDRLAFKPKLSLALGGGTKRSEHPALTAVLKARKGDANLGRVQVTLPHSEFLAQSHIRTICTRVQFAAGAGGGAQCPPGSIYGKVTATSPLVDYPLTGNVYLRSSSNSLPDMVLALHGPPSQPLAVEAVGRIDSIDGGIRTTFAAVPDAPLTKVVLKFPAGKKSLLENSTNLCRSTNRASVQMDAQNGKKKDFAAVLRAKCPKARARGNQRR